MTTQSSSTFTLDSRTSEMIDDRVGAQLSRMTLTKTFAGDLVGTGTVEMLSVQTQHGSAAYVALERIEGTLHGRAGSFILRHDATMTRGVPAAEWAIVPDSGMGGLTGISGLAQIIVEPDGSHTFLLDYDLAEA